MKNDRSSIHHHYWTFFSIHTNLILHMWTRLQCMYFYGFQREEERDLLFHLFVHSLLDSCMYPDWRLNPQPWCIRTTLQPTELPIQGQGFSVLYNGSAGFDSEELQYRNNKYFPQYYTQAIIVFYLTYNEMRYWKLSCTKKLKDYFRS